MFAALTKQSSLRSLVFRGLDSRVEQIDSFFSFFGGDYLALLGNCCLAALDKAIF